MRTCPNCRQPVEDGQGFCPSCMSPIKHLPNIVAVCRFCGKPLNSETRCCTGCGRSGDSLEDASDRWKTGPLSAFSEAADEPAAAPAAPVQPVEKAGRAVPTPPGKKTQETVPTQEFEVKYAAPPAQTAPKKTSKKWLPILLSAVGGAALAVALVLLIPKLIKPDQTEQKKWKSG